MLRGEAWRRVVVGAGYANAILLGLIVAGPMAATMTLAEIVRPGSPGLAQRASSALVAVVVVLVFLVVQRRGVRERRLVLACYAIGTVAALVHSMG